MRYTDKLSSAIVRMREGFDTLNIGRSVSIHW